MMPKCGKNDKNAQKRQKTCFLMFLDPQKTSFLVDFGQKWQLLKKGWSGNVTFKTKKTEKTEKTDNYDYKSCILPYLKITYFQKWTKMAKITQKWPFLTPKSGFLTPPQLFDKSFFRTFLGVLFLDPFWRGPGRSRPNMVGTAQNRLVSTSKIPNLPKLTKPSKRGPKTGSQKWPLKKGHPSMSSFTPLKNPRNRLNTSISRLFLGQNRRFWSKMTKNDQNE